ncbi:uncharacterized protein LOC133876640 isoform X5 [Alnus glutinosa]|uniref:uncharacterized protein LOC133876640 isoform X5 n=1 Tax=Alnus glutinosa TaxID=3517 RepID=UPI002D784EB9|nr:uncharacterized protein LOC133876640 isoform X5 [Alnus glutinosa]
MAVSSACFQVPTLLQIPSSRKQLLQTHRYNRSSRPERHDRATLLHKCFSQRQSQSNSTQKEKEEFEFERLFSNLNQATLKREPGSLSSAIFLVAGTTVGAGILAIPAVTQESGFLASAVACIGCWVFMVVTGLLIAEVNVNTMCELGSGGVSLLVLHLYTLRPSCGICGSFFGYFDKFSRHSIMGKCNFVFIDFWMHMLLRKAVASGDLHWDALLKANFEAVPMSIPIIALSFVYQNVVPVLCTDLEGNLAKVRTAIVLGTAIPLVLFLVWNGVILGSITNLEMGSGKILDPIQQLQSSNGVVGPIIQVFSLLAIATSYIGFILGLADFLADLLKLPTGQSRPLPYLLTLIPPLVLSLLDPEIFFKALDFAGTYGVLVLFGILPAAMSWSERYSNPSSSMKLAQLVPGGRLTLSLIIGGAGCVVFSEILENFGHP